MLWLGSVPSSANAAEVRSMGYVVEFLVGTRIIIPARAVLSFFSKKKKPTRSTSVCVVEALVVNAFNWQESLLQ